MGNLLLPIDSANLPTHPRVSSPRLETSVGTGHTHLIDALQVRTESTVDTKDTAVDDSAEGKVVEDLAAPAPDVGGAVLALALVVEAVDLCDLAGLVVAADEGHALGVADLEGEEEEEGLDGVEAAVDEVACGAGRGWDDTCGGGRRTMRLPK